MRNSKPIDKKTGFEIDSNFRRFNQKNDIFCRSDWDPEIQSKKVDKFFAGYDMPHAKARNIEGYEQKDYALRNAAWHVSNILRDQKRKIENRKEGFLDSFTAQADGWNEPYPFNSPEEATKNLKRAASIVGSGLIGICEYDHRWVYKSGYDEFSKSSKGHDIPDDMPFVIVVGQPMDEELTATVPSALSGAATGLGYTHDSVFLLTLAQYIRNLGYRAIASMNDSALAIPLAVQAGLGEIGRHSLLITKEYGPRLRLGKIFTDMPLLIDEPKQFGVKKFCDVCKRCSAACPPKAIPSGPPSKVSYSISNLKGIRRWTTYAEKCFKFWAGQNSDCSICIRVCPYNRDFTKWYNRVWRFFAGTSFRALMLRLDNLFNQRARVSSGSWWNR